MSTQEAEPKAIESEGEKVFCLICADTTLTNQPTNEPTSQSANQQQKIVKSRKALNSGNETNIKFRTANKQDEMRKLTDDDDDDKQSVSRGSKHFKDLCLEFY